MGGFQPDGLGDAQPGGVTSGQDRPVFGAGHATEKVEDLFRAENDGQLLRFLGGGDNVFDAPILVKRDFVEETQGPHGQEDGTGSQLLFIGQVHLVGTDLLRPELVRWFAEISSKQRDLLHVRGLGMRGEIAHLHILDHALAKGSHGKLLCEMEWAARAASPCFRTGAHM